MNLDNMSFVLATRSTNRLRVDEWVKLSSSSNYCQLVNEWWLQYLPPPLLVKSLYGEYTLDIVQHTARAIKIVIQMTGKGTSESVTQTKQNILGSGPESMFLSMRFYGIYFMRESFYRSSPTHNKIIHLIRFRFDSSLCYPNPHPEHPAAAA